MKVKGIRAMGDEKRRCFAIAMEAAKKANEVRKSRGCPFGCQSYPLPELCLDGACCLVIAVDIAAKISGMKPEKVEKLLNK